MTRAQLLNVPMPAPEYRERAKTIGTKAAAGQMARDGFPLRTALRVLAGARVRPERTK